MLRENHALFDVISRLRTRHNASRWWHVPARIATLSLIRLHRLRNAMRIAFLGPVLFLCLAPLPCGAQESVALSGTVTDVSEAVVPGAAVVARSLSTGRQTQTVSDGLGNFVFSQLAPGNYIVTAIAAGFSPAKANVAVGLKTSILHLKLGVAAARETIEVNASSVGIDTSSTSGGGALRERAVEAMPLNGRSFTDTLAFEPGVIPASSAQPNAVVMSGVTSTPPSADLDAGNLSVNGQRETANGFIVNGSDVVEDINMGTAIVPNLDSIQELKVLTNNFDAEYGNFSGGQVVVTTKSGTDHIHGDAFAFFRNTELDARNYFEPERAKYDRNQLGGTLGGPIRKDKAFFFADYQGTRMTQGVETGLISVPSAMERSGDFSGDTGLLTGTVSGSYWAKLLSQHLGYAVTASEPYYTTGCTNSDECVFPDARIPESAWSAPAKALLRYIPQPNQGPGTFSTAAYEQTLHDDKGAARIDSTSRFGNLSAYYSQDDFRSNDPYPTGQGGANVPGFNAISTGHAQLLSLSATKIFGPDSVNQIHASYMRFANVAGQPVGGVGPSLASQGFVEGPGTLGIVPLDPKIEGIENVEFNDFTFGVDTTGLIQANNTWELSDDFTRVLGVHSLKFGMEFHIDQVNVNPDAVFNGSFQFTGSETGSDFADFLLGIPSYYRQGDSRSFYLRNKYVGVYGQDSWKVKSNLTLNYGARWDLLPPWHEKYNQLQTLIPGRQSVVFPGAPQGIVFPGDPGIPPTLAPVKYTDFAPRVGLAWAPDFGGGALAKIFGGAGQTSIRASYGQFYTAFAGLSASIMSANPPYGYDYNSSQSPLFSTPFMVAATGQSMGQPFPSPIAANGASSSHPDTSVDWSKYLPITGVPSFYYRNVSPYAESYTFSVERELAPGTVLNVGYVGSQGHHLLVLTSANLANPALCLSVSQASEVIPGTPTCGPFNETGLFTRANGETVQVRGPYSADFGAITYQKTIGNSSYNALEISLRHRSKPLEIVAGYTFSKSLDDSSSLAEEVNPAGPGLTRALSAFDMRQNFVVNYDWNLFLDHLTRHENRWTQGWTLSGVARFGTGMPVTLYNNNDTSLLGTVPNGINNNGLDTPEVTPGDLNIHFNPRSGKPAFNRALFSLPPLGQMGNARRRYFAGPGIDNFDTALQKRVRLTEARSLEFRFEVFNTFNHAQFFGPAAVDGDISSASFGQIVNASPPRLAQLAARLVF